MAMLAQNIMRRTPTIAHFLVFRAALFVCVFLYFLTAAASAQSTAPKRVLLLYWYSRDWPANTTFEKNFLAVLNSAGPQGSIEYYAEYLESNRFPGDDQEAVLHGYLKQKYATRHIDVVVAGSDMPLQFLL